MTDNLASLKALGMVDEVKVPENRQHDVVDDLEYGIRKTRIMELPYPWTYVEQVGVNQNRVKPEPNLKRSDSSIKGGGSIEGVDQVKYEGVMEWAGADGPFKPGDQLMFKDDRDRLSMFTVTGLLNERSVDRATSPSHARKGRNGNHERLGVIMVQACVMWCIIGALIGAALATYCIRYFNLA